MPVVVRASVLLSGTSEKTASPSGGEPVDRGEEVVVERQVGLGALSHGHSQRQPDP